MMKKEPSVSIVVPAYNEEENLEATIRNVSQVLVGMTGDYEFIIVNDCSKDKTGEIADRLVKEDPKVKVFHNDRNRGLGWNYRKGVELATKEYVLMVPGDNELKPDSVRYVLGFEGQTDLVIPYPENVWLRPYMRQMLSLSFTALLNWVSGFHIGYYNGAVLARKRVLDRVRFDTNGFAFQAEILVQLLNQGFSYKQIPFQLNYSSKRLTAFRLKNVMSVLYTIFRLTLRYRFGFGSPTRVTKLVPTET